VRDLAEHAYFVVCRALGWLLRSGKYSKARIVDEHGERLVRKRRLFYAPFVVWLGGPLVKLLATGGRVLPQRDWENQERRFYQMLRRAPIRIASDGTLILPCLPGDTLATLLENRALEPSDRKTAIELAVIALAELHRLGLTHGDAMAENVLVDLGARVANWFDFETVHESRRPMVWRRADDLRALLATCLARTVPDERAAILKLVLDVYSDDEVTPVLAASFTSAFVRPLAFHLAQAGLSHATHREIARLLQERLDGEAPGPRLRAPGSM
jgi:hypothetical protein